MRYIFCSVGLTAVLVLGANLFASNDEPTASEKKNAETLEKFRYPGSKPYKSGAATSIAFIATATPDDLNKVAKWYHKAFSIGEAYFDGIADIPWPAGVKATEARGQQQWALFRDDIRPKDDGTTDKAVREGTTRAFIARTPEHTVFVMLNRTPADKLTLISVVGLGDPIPTIKKAN
jgi:hypothetical protein